jgi:hypothetical protein
LQRLLPKFSEVDLALSLCSGAVLLNV